MERAWCESFRAHMRAHNGIISPIENHFTRCSKTIKHIQLEQTSTYIDTRKVIKIIIKGTCVLCARMDIAGGREVDEGRRVGWRWEHIFQIDFIQCKENNSFSFLISSYFYLSLSHSYSLWWKKSETGKSIQNIVKWISPRVSFASQCLRHQNRAEQSFLFPHGIDDEKHTRAKLANSGNEYFHTTRAAWHKIKIELQIPSSFHIFTHKNVLSIARRWWGC